jgi:hypothetical protein
MNGLAARDALEPRYGAVRELLGRTARCALHVCMLQLITLKQAEGRSKPRPADDGRGCIPSLTQELREGDLMLGQAVDLEISEPSTLNRVRKGRVARFDIVMGAVTGRVFPRQDRSMSGQRPRRRRPRSLEHQRVAGEGIERGRNGTCISVCAQVIRPRSIESNNDDIRGARGPVATSEQRETSESYCPRGCSKDRRRRVPPPQSTDGLTKKAS